MLNFWGTKQQWHKGKFRGIAPAEWITVQCPHCERKKINLPDTQSAENIETQSDQKENVQTNEQRLDSKSFEWNWLPECYCITLKSRPERLDNAVLEFHKVGLCNKVIFYQTERDKLGGMRGCWESHRAIAKKCLQEKVPWYLVFEDDVMFDTKIFGQNTIDQIKDALDNLPKDWCFLFLGGIPRLIYPLTLKHHYVGYSGWLTHAGFYSSHLAEQLYEMPFDLANEGIENKSDYLEVDDWFAKNFILQTFLFFPPIAFVNSKLESDLIHDRQPVLKQLQETYSQELNQVYLWFSLIYPIILSVSIFIISSMVIYIMVNREAYIRNVGINLAHSHTTKQLLNRKLTYSVPSDFNV